MATPAGQNRDGSERRAGGREGNRRQGEGGQRGRRTRVAQRGDSSWRAHSVGGPTSKASATAGWSQCAAAKLCKGRWSCEQNITAIATASEANERVGTIETRRTAENIRERTTLLHTHDRGPGHRRERGQAAERNNRADRPGQGQHEYCQPDRHHGHLERREDLTRLQDRKERRRCFSHEGGGTRSGKRRCGHLRGHGPKHVAHLDRKRVPELPGSCADGPVAHRTQLGQTALCATGRFSDAQGGVEPQRTALVGLRCKAWRCVSGRVCVGGGEGGAREVRTAGVAGGPMLAICTSRRTKWPDGSGSDTPFVVLP